MTTNSPSTAFLSDREYLTESIAADFLTLSVHTLRRYRQIGGGPAYLQMGANRIAYARTDLVSWAESRRVRNTAEGEILARQAEQAA
jgi:hypothetical protein